MRVALIEFYVTENEVFIFALNPHRSGSDPQPLVKSVPIKQQQLRALTSMIWSFNKNPIIVNQNIAHFQDIGAKLIEPILEYLDPCDILYIVPHKELHYVPLHAILVNGKPLCEQVAVVYLPNASLLPFCQANNAKRKDKNYQYKKIFTMGIGAKEDTKVNRNKFTQESRKIGQIFDIGSVDCNTGVMAGKKKFIENAPSCDLIHIASHGYFDKQNPLGSGPLLSWARRYPMLENSANFDKHILKAEEFYQLKLKANLMVLSGCFTGRNKVRPGDELLGLARGLFIAGVPSMILSLWEAHHDASIHFMKCFYTELKKGIPKAIAYQKAQNYLRQQLEFQEMKYWAPFILIGDWL